ncbi:chloride channel protein [Limnobacter humi]|uniref:Chloride channel protein n=1 Tax=Limnobacter humi TaxID=1778671 RepID=A0ABT1WHJ0_9BURK|nr:chloride channel protein [Limnobacter humi]
MNPKPKYQWLAHSARRSRFMADRSIVALMVYAFALMVGAVAVGFAYVADYAAEWNKELFENHTLLALCLPPVVFPAVLWICNQFFPGAAGGGIPQAIKIIRHPKPRLISHLLGPKSFFGKLILTPVVLAAGASSGREGPTIQLGAAFMGFAHRVPAIARLFDARSLVIAGGAAGLAAAFNTPLGGLMFAFEELGRSKLMKHTSTLLMAIVLAGLVTLIAQGNYSYFGYSNATIDWGEEWLTILALAVFCGVIGGLYGRAMLIVVNKNTAVGRFRSQHPYWFATICGGLLSLMAYFIGAEVLGAGYHETKLALQDDEALPAGYFATKMVATLISYASGVPGGVFAPTLSIGAGVGQFFAGLVNHDAAPLMLLAMVGVLSAITHCPITAFVILLEMVDNHELVMPLIFVSAISTQVSKRILPASIYHMLANQIKVSFQTTSTPDSKPEGPKT